MLTFASSHGAISWPQGFFLLLDPSLEVAASYLAEESSKECGAAHLDAKEELLLTFNTIC